MAQIDVPVIDQYFELIRIIEAIEPTYDPPVLFRVGHDDLPIDVSDYAGTPFDSTRRFDIVPGTVSNLAGSTVGTFNGSTLVNVDTLFSVQVRYYIPPADDGWRRLKLMTWNDELQIIQAICPGTNWIPTNARPPGRLAPLGATTTTEIGAVTGLYVMTIPFTMRIMVGECPPGP